MTAREDLAEVIRDGVGVWRTPLEAADAIIAAGYGKLATIEPEHMRIENGYLVAEVNGCTCGGGGPECNYAHENGCGLEPLADITDALERSGYGKLADAFPIIRDLADPDECWFDHHGGCQAHGYLSLEPGETCPQHDAKEWLKANEGSAS